MLYSMNTSDIDFIPHQFQPVLRFFESPTSRLLIADEAGPGKTIEAALICKITPGSRAGEAAPDCLSRHAQS